MTADQAETLGSVGPTARASGVPRDIRVDAPYAAYADFPVKLITGYRAATWKRASWCASTSCSRATA